VTSLGFFTFFNDFSFKDLFNLLFVCFLKNKKVKHCPHLAMALVTFVFCLLFCRNVGSFRPESGRVSNSPFLKNSAYTSPDQNQTSHLVKLERTVSNFKKI
jgi:hypothetical protein